MSSLYVFKDLFPIVKETPLSSKGWHDIETWSLVVTTGATVVAFAIRPVDIYAFICDEDEDAKKGAVRYYLWFYNKVKKKLNSSRRLLWLWMLSYTRHF